MNSSYRVKNEADYEMVLDGLQSEILKQTSTCMNYSNAQEWIDSKLIQMAKRILFYEGQLYNQFLEEVTSNIPKNFETLNITSKTNCESWSRHLVTFLFRL